MYQKYFFYFLLILASTTPVMKDLMKYVSDDYAADWKRIGYFLEMSVGAMKAIERNFPSDVKWCCEHMFEEWLQKDTNATWGKVFAAIDSLHNMPQAEISVSTSAAQGTI